MTTLALCLAFYFILPAGAPLVAYHFAAAVLVAHVAIDFEWQLLLDKLNLALAALALVAVALICHVLPLDKGIADWALATHLLMLSLAGAVVYAGLSAGLRFVVGRMLGREPMGLGDVKFFAAAGMWLGPDITILANFMMASGLAGIALGLFWRWRYGAAAFPFGPALIAAFAGFLLAQQGHLAAAVAVYGNSF